MLTRVKSNYVLFTTLHLSSPCIFWGSEIIPCSLLQPSLKTSAGHLWWPSFVISSGSAVLSCISKRLRVYTVKSGEECPATLHRSEALCLSGFQAVWWRVKSKIESSLFTRKTGSGSKPYSKSQMAVLKNSSSRRIVLCLAMAQSCPGRGQYCAVTRQ